MVETIKVDMTVDRIKSKSKEDRAFALKLNNYFCPMTDFIIGQRLLSSFRAKFLSSNISVMNQFESVM